LKDLTFKDVLFILAFPYILLGYIILCLLHTSVEHAKRKIETILVVRKRLLGTYKRQLFLAVVTAIGFGLMESAWTDVRRGVFGPSNTWLGIFTLIFVFLFISYPYVWWIPSLGILEEFVHHLVGHRRLPNYDDFFHHWSVGLLGFNIYPWITFPLITLIGELVYRKVYKSKS
jgi:hypothetical protein